MIIKKYVAVAERDAIELAKNELGSNAIVMNIKKVHPKGIFKLFLRTKVEVTAALDENLSYEKNISGETEASKETNVSTNSPNKIDVTVDAFTPEIAKPEEEANVNAIEEKLNSLQKLLEKQINETVETDKEPIKASQEKNKEKVENTHQTKTYKDLVFKKMLDNEVDEKIAAGLINEIDNSLSDDATVDNFLASIYQKIILTLGRPYTINPEKNSAKFIFFLGSTGVGKTTTIAKIASHLKLNRKSNIALVTADTYRIAAVEQLKTYANILDVNLKVIYSPSELGECLPKLRKYDICLIDTAGRSHKNQEQIQDIKELIEQVPIAEREVYLLLNAGAKYTDLIDITKTYSNITDYSMIFTKLDETSNNGVLLNLKVLTKHPLSYVTWGQNVPEDFGEIDAQEIAKTLLGGKL